MQQSRPPGDARKQHLHTAACKPRGRANNMDIPLHSGHLFDCFMCPSHACRPRRDSDASTHRIRLPMELGPNGLPYSRCPPVKNEWTKYSVALAQLPGDPVATMHPAIIARQRDEVGGGFGLFACNGLSKGEVVWAEPANAGSDISAVPRTRAWIEALPPASKRAYCHFMYKTGDDEFQSLAEFNDVAIADFPSVRTVDVANYMNHSCTPTCLFVDGGEAYTGLMVAARDLLPGDEITFDYCTSEDSEVMPA